MFNEMEVVSVYTRKQAIEDGVLVDISEHAKRLFKAPLAITDTAFEMLVDKFSDFNGFDAENVIKRLMNCFFGLAQFSNSSQLVFDFEGYTLKSIASGGDSGELVLTLMLPEED